MPKIIPTLYKTGERGYAKKRRSVCVTLAKSPERPRRKGESKIMRLKLTSSCCAATGRPGATNRERKGKAKKTTTLASAIRPKKRVKILLKNFFASSFSPNFCVIKGISTADATRDASVM